MQVVHLINIKLKYYETGDEIFKVDKRFPRMAFFKKYAFELYTLSFLT